MTKLPSGILVRDSSNNAIYFIDNGKKRHITDEEVLAGGAFVDIDPSHLSDVPDGKAITSKPDFDWKSQNEINQMLSDTGISWQEPRGFDPSVSTPTITPTSPSTEQATLYSPDGQSEIVDIGSDRASELQSEGWGLTEDSYEDTGADISMYDTLINNSPFLTEQFQDPAIQENFDKMSPTLQMAYLQMMQSLGAQIEAGQVINPNIEITPAQIQEFTDQAISELDPYYQEQISSYKDDLDTSLARLTEDFETGVRNAEEPFKRNLAVQAENEAQAGTVYGSERGVRETTNVENQQRAIDDVSKTLGRKVEDQYTAGERYLGSDILGGIGTPSISEYTVSTGGIQQSGSRDLFSPTGDLIGSLPKEQETAVRGRAKELEEDYRRQRNLNINF